MFEDCVLHHDLAVHSHSPIYHVDLCSGSGMLGLAAVVVLTIIVWAVALSWQVTFTRESVKDAPRINYHDDNYKDKGALFFFCTLTLFPSSLCRMLIPHRS